jgi:predicted 3-demethylubiquinone-9 3-methyltransferase (glyoxalase superfamily)
MEKDQLITSCLWFDTQAEEAARFYTTLFPNSSIGTVARYGKEGYEIHKQPEGAVMTVEFNLGGMKFLGLNGGPLFKFNPSISFYVVCESMEETDKTWHALLDGGTVLMPLDKYDWSEKYGWLNDKFGLSWQISFGKLSDVGQKITPFFMYANKQFGRAEEAVKFYTSIFDNSSITGILKHGPEAGKEAGTVIHAQFRLAGQTFMAIDSIAEHQFDYNEAVSMVINCSTQEDIDAYWQKLTEGGEEGPCGWLKDKFGISWQVVPVQLAQMLKSPDKEKAGRVTKAFLKMKKFNIKELEKAFQGNERSQPAI